MRVVVLVLVLVVVLTRAHLLMNLLWVLLRRDELHLVSVLVVTTVVCLTAHLTERCIPVGIPAFVVVTTSLGFVVAERPRLPDAAIAILAQVSRRRKWRNRQNSHPSSPAKTRWVT